MRIYWKTKYLYEFDGVKRPFYTLFYFNESKSFSFPEQLMWNIIGLIVYPVMLIDGILGSIYLKKR